jgi:hypothetical protein
MEAGWGAIITCRQDVLVPDGHRSDMVPLAGSPFSDYGRNFQKIFIDIGTSYFVHCQP